MKTTKKAQVPEWLVSIIYYLLLLAFLAVLVWLLISGKATRIFNSIIDKVRFF